MHKLIVLYGHPADPTAFDEHYARVHVPLGLAVPGLVSFTTGHPATLDGSPAPYHLVAELLFESADAWEAASRSPEMAAAAADVANFASGGVTMLVLPQDEPAVA